MTEIGHNSKEFEEGLQKLVVDYVDCDRQSMELNDKRADLRELAERKYGLDKGAFQAEIARTKRELKQRDEYDESVKTMRGVLKQMDMEELWSHVIEREEAKTKAREEEKEEKAKKKAAAKKAAEEQKAKDDEYKPAAERKPKAAKVVSGKDAAAGEKSEETASIGEQQAAAFQQAHGNA